MIEIIINKKRKESGIMSRINKFFKKKKDLLIIILKLALMMIKKELIFSTKDAGLNWGGRSM